MSSLTMILTDVNVRHNSMYGILFMVLSLCFMFGLMAAVVAGSESESSKCCNVYKKCSRAVS